MPEDPNSPAPLASHIFHKGDQVCLVKGSRQGVTGTFLRLRTDPKWANIREPDKWIRAHPVEWMALSTPPDAQQ